MKRTTTYSFAMLYLIIGSAVFSLGSIFRHRLSDFALGFCEGVSIVLIISSGIYLLRYFLKKRTY